MHSAHFTAKWRGPCSWPGHNAHDPLPDEPGVYLWTFRYGDGYLIYAAGITRRPMVKRFREHTRCYQNGTYTLFDLNEMQLGKRVEIWHGFWTRTHPEEKHKEYEQRTDELAAAAQQQMASFAVFTAAVGTAPRILERFEAAIMESLYESEEPYCDIPDRGMQLAPRWRSESEIIVTNESDVVLYALPNEMVI